MDKNKFELLIDDFEKAVDERYTTPKGKDPLFACAYENGYYRQLLKEIYDSNRYNKRLRTMMCDRLTFKKGEL